MNTPKSARLLLPLFGLLVACGDSGGPDAQTSTDGASTGADSIPGSTGSTTAPGEDTSTGEDDDSSGSESGGDTDVPSGCVPPPLLLLRDIPDNPSLAYDDEPDVVATFEVDGHDLIGKHVTDIAAAQGGLKLWQEVMLRIPENQLLDLVQLDISLDTDPVAYFNRNGNVTTTRVGLKIGFSVETFALNQDDPCAPLEPRRGTFDWSLVHEFGHLRGLLDESWFLFLDTFPDVQGPGDGYPEDGSPILTGDFVTSYAERDDGDEDYAESWTTYVMLPASDIPALTGDDPLALQKVHWMDQQPDLRELREAIRITESDHVGVDVPAAPRLDTSIFDPGDGDTDSIVVPAELVGQWRESPTDGVVVTFASDDIILAAYEGGVETSSFSLGDALEAEALDYFELHGGSPTLAYSYIQEPNTDRFNHDFFLQDDGDTVVFARERLDAETGDLEFLPEVTLVRVP
ncbi:MAG: hypothetical protein KUG77_24220 [Nannocystaceae bacterium]|nr:hypothetical protein [Nannocystaceae bacterium]